MSPRASALSGERGERADTSAADKFISAELECGALAGGSSGRRDGHLAVARRVTGVIGADWRSRLGNDWHDWEPTCLLGADGHCLGNDW